MFYHKPGRYNYEDEIDRRRPFFQRQQTRAIIAILLLSLIWLVLQLLGIDYPFPFHFWL
jgi:hypothetical protein